MILTDGTFVDQQKTINTLVDGSFFHLSVIIIGIGDDHFKEMIGREWVHRKISPSNAFIIPGPR